MSIQDFFIAEIAIVDDVKELRVLARPSMSKLEFPQTLLFDGITWHRHSDASMSQEEAEVFSGKALYRTTKLKKEVKTDISAEAFVRAITIKRIELLVTIAPKTTREIMTGFNSASKTGRRLNYEQVNKALNLLYKQGRISKNVEHASRVLYFRPEE